MVIPVVVEMRVVASVIDRPAKAAVEVETAMRPRRDTGEPQGKTLISGCRDDRSSSTRFLHLFCVSPPLRDFYITLPPWRGEQRVDFFS